MNVPPVSPAPGRCWLVGDAPTGVWEEHAGAPACWTPNGWRFLAAHDGMRVWLTSVQLWAERVAGTWRVGAITGTSLTINGQSVVGPRLGPVGVPSGGSVVDVEARSAIATLIARLQAHGLISS